MKHFFKEIQGWASFVPWYKEAVNNAPKDSPSIFVELGIWKGRSTAYMGVEIVNSRKPIKFYAFDTFQGSDEPAHHADPVIQQGKLEVVARNNLMPLIACGAVTVIKCDSAEAAGKFLDGEVDFVFIDAGHTEELVWRDINAWWPKLKIGGVMAGDDYTWKGVRSAVNNFFSSGGVNSTLTPKREDGTVHPDSTSRIIKTDFGAKGEKCWRVTK